MEFFTNPIELKMVPDSFYIPKDNPHYPKGEDAHFVSEESQVIGIADGVGGWSRRGIDAGEYARELMKNAEKAAGAYRAAKLMDPKGVLKEAFLNTKAQGSSTACIICLDGKFLRAANLGDSRFMVIRQRKSWYMSAVQQHGFNYPYQLGGEYGNVPEEAQEFSVELKMGDVVIAGTDGLFDNLFPEDIEAAVEHGLGKGSSPEMLSFDLARLARLQSLQQTATPFEAAAYEAGVQHFGGKYDDVTVVVAYVVPGSMLSKAGIL